MNFIKRLFRRKSVTLNLRMKKYGVWTDETIVLYRGDTLNLQYDGHITSPDGATYGEFHIRDLGIITLIK